MTCPNISKMYSHEGRPGPGPLRPGEADTVWETGDWRTLKSDPAKTGSPLANKNSSLISVN